MIKVVASGLLTSIQDLGRFGHRESGVPVSGAMDMASAIHANRVLGNDENEPIIEFTASGPVLEFTVDAMIAITGALFGPIVDNKVVEMNKPIWITKGSRLSFSQHEKGVRGYLAVAGGFKSEKVLGSASYYEGITKDHKLRKGTTLKLNTTAQRRAFQSIDLSNAGFLDFDDETLEVFAGPEFKLLNESAKDRLLNTRFVINPQSNRMAYVLESIVKFTAPEIITSPVQPGTVQLTPSGAINVLMRDAQTTGGYARIFQLTEMAIHKLAQKRAGTNVFFRICDPPFDIPS